MLVLHASRVMNTGVLTLLPVLSVGYRDYDLGQWDVGNHSTFFASCIRCPRSTAPPPPLSVCAVTKLPPSIIVASLCPTPCTSLIIQASVGLQPCTSLFCCNSVDIGDNVHYHPPPSCSLVAPPSGPHFVPIPRLSASKHPHHFPATHRPCCIHVGG